jgi:hypothetical protein
VIFDPDALTFGPHCDGVYITRDDLASSPDDGRVTPFAVNGEFHVDARSGPARPASSPTM